MNPFLRELLDLFVRWIHFIAGIMWVGNSMLFNWLDRNLYQPEPDKRYPGLQGKIWLLHSGAFYEIDKKLLGAGVPMPKVLHWFKWQSYTTWLTGVLLLVVVYSFGGQAMLVDAASSLSTPQAALLGLGTVFGGFFVYDLLWRSGLQKWPLVLVPGTLALFAGAVWALTHFLTGRAAFIHVGALLGTCMSGNVFFHIVPSQRHLVQATEAGQPQDPAMQARAKGRSIHNNYLTFPLLFIMVSNHFPSTFGNSLNWVVLWVLMLGGALARHFMNIRFHQPRWAIGFVTVVTLTVLATGWLTAPTPVAAVHAAPVPFMKVAGVIERRCIQCHATQPTDEVFVSPPNGVMFDTPAQVKAQSARIQERVVVTKTMPMGNKTGITEEERALLAAWIAQGSPIE